MRFYISAHLCALTIASLCIVAATVLLFPAGQAKSESEAQSEPDAPSVSVPAGFAVSLVTAGLKLPTDMVFLPTGDILVSEKGNGEDVDGIGRVRYIKNGVLQQKPVLEVGTNVVAEAGVLAILLDPGFAQNHFFYLWYMTGNKALNWTGTSQIRLSRFTFDPGVGTASGEKIMFQAVAAGGYHNGGGLRFDQDGSLLIAIGDTTPLVRRAEHGYSGRQGYSAQTDQWRRGGTG
ncbi:MAG: PQQ-dependent sugar dehydrogenase [Caldilineaceae bacterium]|nr:PQQ-dependent sugar dehydrogenase [Caldilineaceae bacterium]